MNLAFLRSLHAVIALVVVAAFVAWHLGAANTFGDRADANTVFLLTTGWFAVAAYVVLALYAARRAAHRLRLTPEFGWRVQLPQLERAQVQLQELQNRIDRRELGGKPAIRQAAKQILREHGVHKTLRIHIAAATSTLGLWQLTVLPREALGRLASWLSAHAWYGIAAALLVWFHGGLRSGTTMGLCLNGLSYFVIGSGLLGAFFWAVGPTWLTRAERELSIEKALALREHFARKLAEADGLLRTGPDRRQQAVAAVAAAAAAVSAAETAAKSSADAAQQKSLQKAVKDAQKDFKKAESDVQSIDRELEALPPQVTILRGQSGLVQREAARLERYRFLLRGWRLLHVPCSVVLLALVAVHVLSIYYY